LELLAREDGEEPTSGTTALVMPFRQETESLVNITILSFLQEHNVTGHASK